MCEFNQVWSGGRTMGKFLQLNIFFLPFIFLPVTEKNNLLTLQVYFLKEEQKQGGRESSSVLRGVLLCPTSTFDCVPWAAFVTLGHLITWETMAHEHGKCVTQGGTLAILVGRMSLCSVSGASFPKQNISIFSAKIFQVSTSIFYMLKFVQKNKVSDRLVVCLEELKVWSLQQICISD